MPHLQEVAVTEHWFEVEHCSISTRKVNNAAQGSIQVLLPDTNTNRSHKIPQTKSFFTNDQKGVKKEKGKSGLSTAELKLVTVSIIWQTTVKMKSKKRKATNSILNWSKSLRYWLAAKLFNPWLAGWIKLHQASPILFAAGGIIHM